MKRVQPPPGENKSWMKGQGRRHHNNKGNHTVHSGKTYDQLKRMARRLGLPFNGKRGSDDR